MPIKKYLLLVTFSRGVGGSDKTEHTDRIQNIAKLVYVRLEFRKRTRKGVKMSFNFVFLLNPIMGVLLNAFENSSLTLTVHFERNMGYMKKSYTKPVLQLFTIPILFSERAVVFSRYAPHFKKCKISTFSKMKRSIIFVKRSTLGCSILGPILVHAFYFKATLL